MSDLLRCHRNSDQVVYIGKLLFPLFPVSCILDILTH